MQVNMNCKDVFLMVSMECKDFFNGVHNKKRRRRRRRRREEEGGGGGSLIKLLILLLLLTPTIHPVEEPRGRAVLIAILLAQLRHLRRAHRRHLF